MNPYIYHSLLLIVFPCLMVYFGGNIQLLAIYGATIFVVSYDAQKDFKEAANVAEKAMDIADSLLEQIKK